MIDEKKITEAEKLLYSLSAIKDILKMLECDVEVTMTLKNGHTETFDCYKEIEKCVVNFIKSTKPYKFEDLKEGMWVWDKKEELCNLIYETRINCAGEQEIEFQFRMPSLDGDEFMNTIFEENRFFPVQMANIR